MRQYSYENTRTCQTQDGDLVYVLAKMQFEKKNSFENN